MHPFRACRQIGRPFVFTRRDHRRDEQVGTEQISGLDRIGRGIVLEVQEQRPLHRQAGPRRLVRQPPDIGREMRIYPRHPREMREQFRGVVILHILSRPIALVRAHHGGEGRHLGPAHREFGVAGRIEQAGIAAAIAMVMRIPQHPRRKRRADHRPDPVVPAEIDRLIAGPQHRAMPLHTRRAGAHEHHHLARRAAPGHTPGVHLAP